ncbi:uncharacterized protein LOC120143383 [Hibiscus syriacus]|uniref:uncharacterized protein LOC120143383 n=1 Tax=Hibiscus syriacus TaxID=106335 RepID=UPI001923EDFB|nr:uncharacterized protein LOC120143383 [Hibiscus syriacus]
MGLVTDPICNNGEETIINVLRDCPTRVQLGSIFYTYILGVVISPPLYLIGGICLRYSYGDYRNKGITVLNRYVLSTMEIIQSVRVWTQTIRNAKGEPRRSQANSTMKHRWMTPRDGAVKLNTNGAMNRQTMDATGGEFIRDRAGTWLVGYRRNIGKCSAFHAEL